MFVKFDDNGKVINLSSVETIEDIMPSGEGFERLPFEVSQFDIKFLRKLNGVISIDMVAKAAEDTKAQLGTQLATHDKWFEWYDNQVSQAQRAQRTGTEWHTTDEQRTYYAIAELDAEANAKQNQMRSLRAQLA